MASTVRLPVLPLRDVVIYPHVMMPLIVGRAAALPAVDSAMTTHGALLLVAQRNADGEDPAAADLYRVGVIARIAQVTKEPNGTARILVEGIGRTRIARFARAGGIMRAVFADETEAPAIGAVDVRPIARRAVADFEEYVTLHRRIPSEVVAMVQAAESPERQAYGIAA